MTVTRACTRTQAYDRGKRRSRIAYGLNVCIPLRLLDDISNDRYAPRAFNHAAAGLSGTFGNCSPGYSFTGSPPRTRDKFVVGYDTLVYTPHKVGMPDKHDADAVVKGSRGGWLNF